MVVHPLDNISMREVAHNGHTVSIVDGMSDRAL